MKNSFELWLLLLALAAMPGCLESTPDDWRDPQAPPPKPIVTEAPPSQTTILTDEYFEEFTHVPTTPKDPTMLNQTEQMTPRESTAPDYKDGPVLTE